VNTQIHPLHVGIVAGETSGDALGAGLIEAIRQRIPNAVFEGIGGRRMAGDGCFSLYPMERLSVMGFSEVINRLPQLLAMRRELCTHFLGTPPDIFVGIDAPDFNLPLERALKRRGIRTLHYVSPAVWAWRRYRAGSIARSADCLLTLFPFEAQYYRGQRLAVRCVGHPLADQLADEASASEARRRLGLAQGGQVIALLPGSRTQEVRLLAEPFLEAAAWCLARRPELKFVVPLANDGCRSLFEKAVRRCTRELPLTLIDGRSLEAMAAADAVLLASGTATLECLLLKRPMVVAYRLSPLSYRIARALLTTDCIALPNLLAGRPVVSELVQHEVTAERLGRELLGLLEDPRRVAEMRALFTAIHRELRREANHSAAQAVLEMTGHRDYAAA
jgi:lipid-A-disaccharide synthase